MPPQPAALRPAPRPAIGYDRIEALPGGYAPLSNMARAEALMLQTIGRPAHLPGIVVLFGPSGYGKTSAAGYVAALHDAVYIECRSFFSQKYFLGLLARELGLTARGTIAQLADAVCMALVETPRPLIVDEVDYLVEKSSINLLRDIHDAAGAPMMLIGEERIVEKLEAWERVHRRILDSAQIQPATLEDALELRDHYRRGVTIADDLVEHILARTRGVAGWIVVWLERIAETASGLGLDTIDRAAWGDRPILAGKARRLREQG